MYPSHDEIPDFPPEPEEEEEIIYVSKSELKRDAQDLLQTGRTLVGLSKANLAKLPLEDDLLDAIALAQKIKNKHAAYKRQLQFLGKLLRQRDTEPLLEALSALQNESRLATRQFHQLEQLRDQLLAPESNSDELINQLLTEHPQGDRQQLRQLVRQAKREQAKSKPPKSARELFQYLRELTGITAG